MIGPSEIRYFLECARMQNLSRAAERIGISQPALTVALQRLEQDLGAPLFHRSKKGVRLTKAGEAFVQDAQALVEQWEKVARSVRRSADTVHGSYVLGCHPSVALYTLPQTLPSLLADYPELRLELRHDLSRRMAEEVIRGSIDLALVINPVRHPDLVIKTLGRDRVSFWASKHESALSQPNTPESVLLCNPELHQTQTLLRKCRMQFARMIPSSSLELLASLADSGAGAAILPGKVAAHWKNLKPLAQAPTFEDELALLYRVENRNVSAIREIAKRLEANA